MAQKVRIFNLNTHPLVEQFKGARVEIEAQDYWRDKKGNPKEIDIYEATDFKGQYHPVEFDGSGKMTNDPKGFKMLRLEPVGEHIPLENEVTAYKCMALGCRHVAPTMEDLDKHAEVTHPNAEHLILPEEDQRLRSKKAKA